jgi:hypothetical protein
MAKIEIKSPARRLDRADRWTINRGGCGVVAHALYSIADDQGIEGVPYLVERNPRYIAMFNEGVGDEFYHIMLRIGDYMYDIIGRHHISTFNVTDTLGLVKEKFNPVTATKRSMYKRNYACKMDIQTLSSMLTDTVWNSIFVNSSLNKTGKFVKSIARHYNVQATVEQLTGSNLNILKIK